MGVFTCLYCTFWNGCREQLTTYDTFWSFHDAARLQELLRYQEIESGIIPSTEYQRPPHNIIYILYNPYSLISLVLDLFIFGAHIGGH